MQTVSENWKSAHRQTLLNEGFVEVSLDIADPEALADVSSQDNGAVYISDTSRVVSEVDRKVVPYCTLEQNLWVLDGARKAIPVSDYGDSGYVGDAMSNDVCVFASKMPVITLNFSKVFDNFIPGITITWSPTYGEFADSFIVTAYNGDTVVATKEVSGNRSVKSLVMMDIVGYNRIVIMVTKWCLPYHRARVEEIFVGINRVYSKAELFDYSHSQSVDPVSTALPKNEIKFSISNVDGEYNPYNEQGMAKYLKERQEVKSRYGLKMNDGSVEWIKGGTFYLSEWSAKQNGLTAEFTARDLLEFMSAIYVDDYAFEYDATNKITSARSLYDLAQAVMEEADLPRNSDGTVKWVIDESLKTKYSDAPLPRDSLANCLQLIANAGECVIYQDRDGVLHIEPLPDNDTDYSITPSVSYSKPEITLSKMIKQVDVKVYTYSVKLDGDGKVVGYDSTSITVTLSVGTTGEIITVDNPMITRIDVAGSVARWLATHLGHRMTLDSSWRADVRLDPLDVVTNANAYGNHRVRMTEVGFKYNGAFRGTGKGKVI